MQSTMMDVPLTLTQILDHAGKYYGSREIVSRLPDNSLHRHSYADFYRRARGLAETLTKAGLRRGDRVATLMWNHYAHLEAYFGIPAAGGVLHTLNLRLHPDDLAWIVNHAEDRILIVDDVLLPLYQQFGAQTRIERVLVVPLTGKPVPEGYENYEDFIAGASGNFEYPVMEETEACGMCYTSGTTGRPKGVVYSHRSTCLHSLAQAMPNAIGLSAGDAVLPVVPMFHANAWGLPFTMTMVGCKQVYPGPHLDPESLLDLFERERVTITGGVPTIWLGILQLLDDRPERWKLHHGMRMLVGGSAAPEAMIRGFDRHRCTVVHGWGMTESSPLASLSTLTPQLREASEDEQYAYRAKQGLPLPFVQLRTVGDDGEVPWDGKTMGELQMRGPWITGSYYKVDDKEKFTDDGYLRTGDVVTVDRHGYIKITDRTKDLIKSGGEWISSVDLENALMGHPAVAEAAVIALPHPKWAERPLAVVVLKQGRQVSAAELRDHLAQHFAKWMLPDGYAFVDEIPRTSTGKFLKLKLRDMFKDWQWDDQETMRAS